MVGCEWTRKNPKIESLVESIFCGVELAVTQVLWELFYGFSSLKLFFLVVVEADERNSKRLTGGERALK